MAYLYRCLGCDQMVTGDHLCPGPPPSPTPLTADYKIIRFPSEQEHQELIERIAEWLEAQRGREVSPHRLAQELREHWK